MRNRISAFVTKYFLVMFNSYCAISLRVRQVKTGLEMLVKSKFEVLKGKKVGLITNPTGVDRNLRSGIDLIFNAPGVKLVALYGPEHGVRGEYTAGEIIGSAIDPLTGPESLQLIRKHKKTNKRNA